MKIIKLKNILEYLIISKYFRIIMENPFLLNIEQLYCIHYTVYNTVQYS